MLKLIIKFTGGSLVCFCFSLAPITVMAQRVDYRDPSLKNRIPGSVNNPSSQPSNSNVPGIPTPAGTATGSTPSSTQGQQVNPQLGSVLLAYGLQPAPACLPGTVVIISQMGGQMTPVCAYPNPNFQPGYYTLDANLKIVPIGNMQQPGQAPSVPTRPSPAPSAAPVQFPVSDDAVDDSDDAVDDSTDNTF